MENGLVQDKNKFIHNSKRSLNPCCNGRWSRTVVVKLYHHHGYSVLILVVMEDGLVRG